MSSSPVIFVPREPGDLKAAHDFHIANVGEYLLPRDIKKFDSLAADGELWVAAVDKNIVGACYVTRGEDDVEAEFGGVIVHPDYQKSGLASALGTVAIARYWVDDAARPLIAHVHVENNKPLDLLTKRLGFSDLGKPIAILKTKLEEELGYPIPSMKADDQGFIRGNTFGFSTKELSAFASRLESGKLAKIAVNIQGRFFAGQNLSETVAKLREQSGG